VRPMRDRELYAQILGIEQPWSVVGVEIDLKAQEVVVRVEASSSADLKCPECGRACGGYDHRERRWRHLDKCLLRTILVAKVPRVECGEHGVRQATVPWAEPNSNFTALFEGLVIDWLKEASFAAVARTLRLSWDEVDGIQGRAVARGLKRRNVTLATRILGLMEDAFRHGGVAWDRGLRASTCSGPDAPLAEDQERALRAIAEWHGSRSVTLPVTPLGGARPTVVGSSRCQPPGRRVSQVPPWRFE
jgi:hypothetical protein